VPEYLEITIDKFIFRVAADRLYSTDGVWFAAQADEGGGQVRVGVTDYVQQRNGDVAFVHVRPPHTTLAAGDEFVEVETIKTNLSLFSPVAGTLVAANPVLETSPETVNEDPYGKGWLAVIAPADWAADRAKLLDPQAYLAAMKSQAEAELQG
jgi:glycine cleavage system H protein